MWPRLHGPCRCGTSQQHRVCPCPGLCHVLSPELVMEQLLPPLPLSLLPSDVVIGLGRLGQRMERAGVADWPLEDA